MKTRSKLFIALIVILFFEVLLFQPLDFMYEDELLFCSYPSTVFDYLVMPGGWCMGTFNPFYVEEWRASEGLDEKESSLEQLAMILYRCNDTSENKFSFYNNGFFRYFNETHSINNSTCEWKKHGTFPDSESLCIPYSDKGTTDEELRNQTHIFDKDSCTWKIDQNYDTVNTKGCPQFCLKDNEPLFNVFSIHERIEKNGNRLEISPQLMILNLTNPVTVTFVNDSVNTVNIFDNARGKWSFKNVEPTSHRNLIINNTGYHEILVQDSRHGAHADIVVLSENTNSLLVGERARMAQIFLRGDFMKGGEVVSVGSGGREPGLTIGIHEKFQDLMEDSEKFYYEKYSNMIPFDVPITIKFQAPIIPQ